MSTDTDMTETITVYVDPAEDLRIVGEEPTDDAVNAWWAHLQAGARDVATDHGIAIDLRWAVNPAEADDPERHERLWTAVQDAAGRRRQTA